MAKKILPFTPEKKPMVKNPKGKLAPLLGRDIKASLFDDAFLNQLPFEESSTKESKSSLQKTYEKKIADQRKKIKFNPKLLSGKPWEEPGLSVAQRTKILREAGESGNQDAIKRILKEIEKAQVKYAPNKVIPFDKKGPLSKKGSFADDLINKKYPDWEMTPAGHHYDPKVWRWDVSHPHYGRLINIETGAPYKPKVRLAGLQMEEAAKGNVYNKWNPKDGGVKGGPAYNRANYIKPPTTVWGKILNSNALANMRYNTKNFFKTPLGKLTSATGRLAGAASIPLMLASELDYSEGNWKHIFMPKYEYNLDNDKVERIRR